VRRSLRTVTATAVLLIPLLVPSRAAHGFACLTTMSNAGGPCLHWTQGGATLTSFLGIPPTSLLNGTLTRDQNAVSAAMDWNAVGAAFHFTVTVGGVFNEPCGSPGPAHACPNTGPVNDNPIIFRNNFCGGAFGDIIELTNNCFDPNTGAMLNAPVFVNSGVPWDAYDGAIMFSNGQALNDFRRVLLHEFGHVLGLDHPDARGQDVAAIMNSHESDLDRLQADDISGIRFLYPHSTPSNVNSCQIGQPGGAQRGWMLWWLPALLGLVARRRLVHSALRAQHCSEPAQLARRGE
jgi:hypothetical protein